MMTSKDLAQEARFAMHGRILRCPFGDNPYHCPLHEIRLLPLDKRIAWLEAKNDVEVVELYRAHNECMACRLDKHEENCNSEASG